MSYKTFFINTNETNFIEKLSLAKSLYPKYITRSCIKTPENQNSLCIDAEDTFFLSLKKSFILGSSFYAKNIIFSHRLNKNLRFSSFLCLDKTRLKRGCTYQILDSLNRFISKPASRLYLFLLLVKPIKGGFNGFCNNFFGFVPRSQLRFMSMAFLTKKKNQHEKKLPFIFLGTSKALTKFTCYKIRVCIANLIIFPCTLRNSFSGRSKYHFLRSQNKINFVFMYKKINKDLENKKIKHAKNST